MIRGLGFVVFVVCLRGGVGCIRLARMHVKYKPPTKMPKTYTSLGVRGNTHTLAGTVAGPLGLPLFLLESTRS